MKFWVIRTGKIYVSHFLYYDNPSTKIKEIHYVAQLTQALRYKDREIGAGHLPRVNAFDKDEHELVEITPNTEEIVKLVEKLRMETGELESINDNSYTEKKKALEISRYLLDVIDFFTKEYTQL